MTICSREHKCLFADGNSISTVGAGLAPAHGGFPNVQLKRIGKIIEKNWMEIPIHYSNTRIDEYIIMPNHHHGILIICQNQGNNSFKERAIARVALTLGSIIGSFKSRCVVENLNFIKKNKLNEIGKIWQKNYYEHVIINDKELSEIRKYIRENPGKWLEDEENSNTRDSKIS